MTNQGMLFWTVIVFSGLLLWVGYITTLIEL